MALISDKNVELLRQVYEEFGPKQIRNKKISSVPTSKFAAMTKREIANWDVIPDATRNLMHRIAKHLEKQGHS